MLISVYGLTGEIAGQVEISEDIFAIPFNEAVVHQAMVRQLAGRSTWTSQASL